MAAVVGAAPVAGAVSPIEWIASGSATPQAVQPARPTVTLGDYCQAQSEPAMTADGKTAYCARVQYTDAYVWSATPDLVATDPHFPVDPGDTCLNPDAVTTGTGERTMYCNPTQSGRQHGTLVWQLQP
ncbi:hypothetical protein ACFYSW_29975 [Rhodococcus aetherivorans]|uniref:hypothetical protein n=1 Tax=Rhodococcus aetherivorans TaxID=191292 RepID=UPI0036A000DE